MSDAFFDFLGAALIPELGADVSAGTTGNVHGFLVGVAAVRAAPDQLVAFVFDDFNFAFVAALLAIVRFGVQFSIHDVIVNMLD